VVSVLWLMVLPVNNAVANRRVAIVARALVYKQGFRPIRLTKHIHLIGFYIINNYADFSRQCSMA